MARVLVTFRQCSKRAVSSLLEVLGGWGEHALEPDPKEIVFALIVGQRFLIKLELLAIV